MTTTYHRLLGTLGILLSISLLLTGCATQQGYQGAGVGALTGATAGVLLDPHNRWRGAMIGGGLGATLGGALTDRPAYRRSYQGTYSPYQNYRQRNSTAQGALIGGATGAAAGALLDHDNRWRGSLIGGALGGFFGGSIGSINSGPSIPVLHP
jgi:surface antigen